MFVLPKQLCPQIISVSCACALPNFSNSLFELDLELNDASISPSKGSDDDLYAPFETSITKTPELPT